MKIETTVRKAALCRLVTFSAPGNIDVRKAMRKLRLKIEEQGADTFTSSETTLSPQGGFASENPTHPIEIDLSDTELRRLDAAFEQTVWDPRTIPEALEDIIWELVDEIKTWLENAEAARKWNQLTEKQQAAILEERAKKAEKEEAEDD